MTVCCLLATHLLAAPQISGGGGGAGGAGGGAGGGGAGGGGAGAGAGGAAGAAAGAAGAAMMAAGTGMMMMNPTMALFPIMLAGASFAKVNTILCSKRVCCYFCLIRVTSSPIC